MSIQAPVMPTIGEIARRLGVPVHRVEYAVRANAVRPCGWAGNARVFSEDAVVMISRAIGKPAVNDRGRAEQAAPVGDAQ